MPSVPSARVHSQAHTAFSVFLLLLPWLNPFTWGPVAPLLQWLSTALALAGSLVVVADRHQPFKGGQAPPAS